MLHVPGYSSAEFLNLVHQALMLLRDAADEVVDFRRSFGDRVE